MPIDSVTPRGEHSNISARRAWMLSQRSYCISTTFFLKDKGWSLCKVPFHSHFLSKKIVKARFWTRFSCCLRCDCTRLLQTWQAYPKTDRTRVQYMVIRWSSGNPARFKTLSRYRRLHALSTISLVFWPHFKLSQRVIPSTWCTLTFSRYVSLTVSRSTSRSLARKERRIFLHFFGLRFIQFSSTQAAMLSRSSCIVDGKPWGTTSEIVMSSTNFQ